MDVAPWAKGTGISHVIPWYLLYMYLICCIWVLIIYLISQKCRRMEMVSVYLQGGRLFLAYCSKIFTLDKFLLTFKWNPLFSNSCPINYSVLKIHHGLWTELPFQCSFVFIDSLLAKGLNSSPDSHSRSLGVIWRLDFTLWMLPPDLPVNWGAVNKADCLSDTSWTHLPPPKYLTNHRCIQCEW